ncbi:Asparagine--tRNA ligase, cytoplasmic 1 [Linum grandiflorum]
MRSRSSQQLATFYPAEPEHQDDIVLGKKLGEVAFGVVYKVSVDNPASKKPLLLVTSLSHEINPYLAEEKFKKPVIVYDYPKGIKAFCMRLNDDKKTVAAIDVLVLKMGEVIGGSQKEERYEVITVHRKDAGDGVATGTIQ